MAHLKTTLVVRGEVHCEKNNATRDKYHNTNHRNTTNSSALIQKIVIKSGIIPNGDKNRLRNSSKKRVKPSVFSLLLDVDALLDRPCVGSRGQKKQTNKL